MLLLGCASTPNPLVLHVKGSRRLAQLQHIFVGKMCLVAQKTVWEKKSFVFEILMKLTNYDLISLALLVSNYHKIGHKSDCFAYIAACLMWISIFEVLKLLHFRSKDFRFYFFWRYNEKFFIYFFFKCLGLKSFSILTQFRTKNSEFYGSNMPMRSGSSGSSLSHMNVVGTGVSYQLKTIIINRKNFALSEFATTPNHLVLGVKGRGRMVEPWHIYYSQCFLF